MSKSIMLLAVLGALTSGCGVMSIGESEYACKGMPSGSTCMSARQVYAATEGQGSSSSLKPEQAAAEPTATAGAPQTRVLIAEGADNAPLPMRARNPLPIRSQAVVMRIAVDPWEDEKGDLYVPGFVYTEIEARRWEIGDRNPQATPMLRPLSVATPAPQPGTR